MTGYATVTTSQKGHYTSTYGMFSHIQFSLKRYSIYRHISDLSILMLSAIVY